jgi:Fe-S-cluster containining protein
VPLHYDCQKCPAYCCSIYGRVEVKNSDLKRLARHFGVTEKEAERRFTKVVDDERVLRRKKDALLGEVCRFLDPKTRGCTIYDGRPKICREYPGKSRCAYYDVLEFERETQGDPDVLPLFQITFRPR